MFLNTSLFFEFVKERVASVVSLFSMFVKVRVET